jgi:membrane protease YdiL (CAAX protease family)
MFALNIFVQWFPLENTLETEFSELSHTIMGALSISLFGPVLEEVLFRGGLQRILATRPMNIHIAIWISAFIFSAIHFQSFGFFPRLIIGAFFGYLAYWSGSLWIAVIAHAVNNSTVIIAHAINNTYGYNLDSLGVVDDGSLPVVATISLIITIVLIYLFPKNKKVTS